MSKNKLIVFFLVLVLIISMLSGCSSKLTTSTNSVTSGNNTEQTSEQASDVGQEFPVFLGDILVDTIVDDTGRLVVKVNDEELSVEELSQRGYELHVMEDKIVITPPENNGNGNGTQSSGASSAGAVNPESQGSVSGEEIPEPIRDIAPKDAYSIGDVGTFYAGETYVPMPVLDKSKDISDIKADISEYLFYVYGYRFLEGQLTTDYLTAGPTIDIIQNEDGNLGIVLGAWRDSYASNTAENMLLNAVLASMYYLTGDKEVASALWNFTDDSYIQHKINIEDSGFTLVDGVNKPAEDLYTWTMTMNGVTVLAEVRNGIFSYYFS